MPSQATQENRSLSLTTPLGTDVLRLVSFSGTETLERKLGILREHCAAVGRDIDEIELSTGVMMRPGGRANDGRGIDPVQLERQYELGVRLFQTDTDGPDHDLGPARQLLAWRDSFLGRP